MKLPRNAKIFRGQLDAAPFAGVIFLLLIFLVFSSKLVLTPGVRIDLPTVSGKVPGISGPTVVVAIDRSGLFYFEGQLVEETNLIRRLEMKLAESREPLTLAIQADRASELERPIQLMNRARALGFREAVVQVRPRVMPIPSDFKPNE